MSQRELARRFNFSAPADDPADEFACTELGSDSWPGVGVMTERHRVTRISLFKGSPVLDEKGLGVGATEANVRQAYGGKLKKQHHAYEASPAAYWTFWRKDRRGIRYETDDHRRVTVIHAGTSSIEYVEGCS